MSEGNCILVVDDEPAIRFFLCEELSLAGYRVLAAASGEEAVACLQQEPVDLVLLDLMLGSMSGLQVMARIGQRPMPPAVILLTAHASLDSAIEAMRRGGCDYLLKPCRTEVLLASVERGLARRREALRQQELLRLIELSARELQQAAPPEPGAAATRPRFLEGHGMLLDREERSVTCLGQRVPLTPTEFRLLLRLMERAGQVVPLGELMKDVHGSEGERWEARSALTTHLWRLRTKLGNAPDGLPYIANVRGQGYRFERGKTPDRH